jgi:hypothetical protein
MNSGTVDNLIESASRRGNIPDAQMTYLTDDFLAMIYEELMAYALPILHARREDYYVEELTFLLSKPDTYIGSPDGTVKHPAWRIPEYAMASSVRDVQAISPGGAYYNLGRTEIDDVPNSMSQGWYFYGNYIVYQLNSIASTAPPIGIRCLVHVKPSRLMLKDGAPTADPSFVVLSGAARIITVNSPVEVVLEHSLVWPGVSGQPMADLVSGYPGFEVKSRELIPVYPASGLTITFQKAPTNPFTIGDWITPIGYTPVVPLPLEMHALLAQRVVVKFLEAQGEQAQLEQARNSLEEMTRQIPLLIQPRAEGKPKKLAPRMGLWRRWRW